MVDAAKLPSSAAHAGTPVGEANVAAVLEEKTAAVLALAPVQTEVLLVEAGLMEAWKRECW